MPKKPSNTPKITRENKFIAEEARKKNGSAINNAPKVFVSQKEKKYVKLGVHLPFTRNNKNSSPLLRINPKYIGQEILDPKTERTAGVTVYSFSLSELRMYVVAEDIKFHELTGNFLKIPISNFKKAK